MLECLSLKRALPWESPPPAELVDRKAFLGGWLGTLVPMSWRLRPLVDRLRELRLDPGKPWVLGSVDRLCPDEDPQ